jgi:hypothetical protein
MLAMSWLAMNIKKRFLGNILGAAEIGHSQIQFEQLWHHDYTCRIL